MTWIKGLFFYSSVSFITIVGLYIAGRIVTRAVLRTLDERKNENGEN